MICKMVASDLRCVVPTLNRLDHYLCPFFGGRMVFEFAVSALQLNPEAIQLRHNLKTPFMSAQSTNIIEPLDIGGFLLEKSIEKGITNLKLNKLIYLAHGYHWGNFELPLINNGELAEAWKHGPVYRSVYNIFGAFKSDDIPLAYSAISTNYNSFDEPISDFLNHL